jgi:hypothetical protein
MQTVTESKTTKPEMTQSLHMVVIFNDGESEDNKTRLFDLGTHEGRVSFSKFAIWAGNRSIDFAVKRISF